MSNKASGTRCYYCTDADIERIAATLKIKSSTIKRTELDDAFQAYFSVSETVNAQPTRKDVRKVIKKLGRTATSLALDLRRASDYDPRWTETEKQRASAIMDMLRVTPGFETGSYTERSGYDAIFHELDTLIDMLDRFATDCSTALATAKPANPGTPGYPGFHALLWRLADVYERLISKRATHTWDAHKERSSGRFMGFVVACLQPLMPENALSVSALGGRIKRTLDERKNYLASLRRKRRQSKKRRLAPSRGIASRLT